jgi:thiamine-phosphate pyrophosphorylase
MITDRRSAGGLGQLVMLIGRRIQEGVDYIQIREKDLEAAELFTLVSAARMFPNKRTNILVNGRLDVALAAYADGLHLPAQSPKPNQLRPICPPGFLIGVSCHTVEEVREAYIDGADYCIFAPVFAPLSKDGAREPHGIDGLRHAVVAAPIPIYALGGITKANAETCIKAGAAGVAGISLFL